MGHHGVASGRGEAAQRAQHLRGAAGRAGDGQVLQRFQRVQLIFRRLGDDGIGDAVLGIEPEIRRGLDGAGQRGGQRVGDVLLGQAELGDAAAVDVEIELRIVAGLLQAGIGDAGNGCDLRAACAVA